MLYPMLFKPIRKEMLWGYESWDISCRPLEMSLVENGSFEGKTFLEVIQSDPIAMLGTNNETFPLLIKIIVAHDDLSVQVHPDDNYASTNGFESGKSEMWYVLKTPGRLIIGLKDGTTPKQLKNNTMQCLNELAVKAGDMIDIRPGLVHAIVGGTAVVEVQQNSDVTFRIYDYGRKDQAGNPRELHIEHALAVTDFAGSIPKSVCESVATPFFSVSKLVVNGIKKESTTPESFSIYTNVEGFCMVNDVELSLHRSVFLPAGIGSHIIKGSATLLKTTGGLQKPRLKRSKQRRNSLPTLLARLKTRVFGDGLH